MTANADNTHRGRPAGDDGTPSFKSLTGAVSQAVQQDILTAKYLPGDKLPIVHLARDYGVSPGAIREALSRLISEGLVEFSEQRGFRAAPVSRAALMDITRTRIMIDAHALRIAIENGSAHWDTEIKASQQRLNNCPPREPDNPAKLRSEWNRLHRAFHRTLIAASESAWLMRYHDQLFDQTVRYRSVASAYETKQMGLRADPKVEHARIVDAVLARDAEAAARAIDDHYMATANLIIAAPEFGKDPPAEKI
jgi:DNA-binding GntR family transcriptional regulator